MRKWVMAAGAIASALLANGQAQAANCANVSFTGQTAVSGWNPLSGAIGTATFSATATRVHGSSPLIRKATIVFLDSTTGTTYLGQVGSQLGPQYEISDGSNIVSRDSSGAPPGTSGAAQFSFPNSANGNDQNGPATFTVRIIANAPGADYVAGTAFSEPLKYSIRCFDSSGSPLGLDSGVAGPTLSVAVPSQLQVTTAGPYNIDFGSFGSTTANVSIGLKSTSTINASITTANGSQMVLSGAVSPYPANSVIPYSIQLNGTTVAATGTPTNLSRVGMTGASWPLLLALTEGVPSGKLPGSYSDTITLTLTPGS